MSRRCFRTTIPVRHRKDEHLSPRTMSEGSHTTIHDFHCNDHLQLGQTSTRTPPSRRPAEQEANAVSGTSHVLTDCYSNGDT